MKHLGLFYKPYYLQDILDKPSDGRLFNVRLIERTRTTDHGVKRYRVLDEAANPNAFVVNEDTGFYVVGVDESVIFYSYTGPEKCMLHNTVWALSYILNR